MQQSNPSTRPIRWLYYFDFLQGLVTRQSKKLSRYSVKNKTPNSSFNEQITLKHTQELIMTHKIYFYKYFGFWKRRRKPRIQTVQSLYLLTKPQSHPMSLKPAHQLTVIYQISSNWLN